MSQNEKKRQGGKHTRRQRPCLNRYGRFTSTDIGDLPKFTLI